MKRKYIVFAIATMLSTNMISIGNKIYADDLTNINNENLILHYNFDNESDGVVEDTSGNGNDGVFEANATIEEDGISGNYLSLDGNSAVKLPDKILNGLEEITVSTWVNFKDDDRAMEDWQRVFDFGNDTNNNFFLSKNRQVELKTSNATDNVGYGQSVDTNKWVHVTVTVGNGEIKYYENGVKTKTNASVVNSLSAYWEGTQNYIGKSKYSADPKLKADIDEFRVYNKALDEDVINKLMYMDMSDETLLNMMSDLLEIDGINGVYKDIELPTEINDVVDIEWISSNPDLIDSTGKVNRPEGEEEVEVVLTAIIKRGDSFVTKEFKAYVIPIGLSGYTLNINADEKLFDVSDMLSGVFFEDINHGADGGLYYELIENRSFQYTRPSGAWSISSDTGCTATIKSENPLNENNSNYIRLYTSSEDKKVSLSNDGYKGIAVKEGDYYDFSVWARNIDAKNDISIEIVDNKGNIISDKLEISVDSQEWTKYSGKIKVNSTTLSAKCVVSTATKGTIDLDMISLFPEKNINSYGLRMDLIDRLEDLEPSFIRFPGGCVLEGHNKSQMYNWKNTIGNIEERKEIENLWGYSQSYGLGFYEYFLLCEDLGAVPVPILNCGMSCQGGSHHGNSEWMAEIGEELNEFIQDALDLIEYCNGDGTGEWSKKRVEAGHPEPFNLKYLGIGNEQWGEEYQKRFEEFQKVINKEYPDIVLVSGSGPLAEGDIYDEAWEWINEKAPNTIVDEHYYMSPEWFVQNTDRYNDFDRNGPQVFIGEYASQSNTLKSAIAEAAYFTGIERNSDVIKMTSYAPLFAKYDDYQWTPDMIWFNGETNYGSANYYVQKLMSTNLGTQMLKDEFIKVAESKDKITGGVALGSWNTKVEYDDVIITDNFTGEKLFTDDFSSDMSSWEVVNGKWNIDNEKIVLNEIAENCMLIGNEKNLSDYTLELTAKKNSGKEGFLIGFGAQDSSNYYWFNIGGWDNTKTVVEKAVNGKKSTISKEAKNFTGVEAGKEYKIKVVVSGDSFECYIDDELVIEYESKDVFTSSSYDEKTGDLIVKIVNTTNEGKEVNVNIDTKYEIPSNATVEYVSSKNLTDTNSFENPEKIAIKTKTIDNVSNSFVYDADKYSANVIRINLKETVVEAENSKPIINASDVTLTIGDKYDPLNGVTATDKEDGDLTSKIIIKENTVNINKAGEYKVIFEVSDSKGEIVTKEIKVNVKEKSLEEVVNSKPIINASDVTLTVGDKYDPLNGVTATDKEDGDLTSKITIKENTVNINKAGIYKVIFVVKDSLGEEVVKEIKVEVKSKVNITVDKDNNASNSDKLPQTGGVNYLMTLLAGGMMALSGIIMKRKNK